MSENPLRLKSSGNEAESNPVLDSWIEGPVMAKSIVGCLSFAWKVRVSLNARKNGALTGGMCSYKLYVPRAVPCKQS